MRERLAHHNQEDEKFIKTHLCQHWKFGPSSAESVTQGHVVYILLGNVNQ